MMAIRHADLSGGPLLKESPTKLAEQIALAVRNDIAGSGWRAGERLANESELPDRYGVSQWTMRQAIRVLELHGIVEARRGQGGGLFIGLPNPSFALDSAIQFLKGDDELNDNAPKLHARLFASVAQLGTLRASAEQREALGQLISDSKADVPAVLDLLAAMTNNRVLSLFAAIATRLITYNHGQSKSELRRLSDAVSAYDASLARRIVGDYLDASGPANTRASSAA